MTRAGCVGWLLSGHVYARLTHVAFMGVFSVMSLPIKVSEVDYFIRAGLLVLDFHSDDNDTDIRQYTVRLPLTATSFIKACAIGAINVVCHLLQQQNINFNEMDTEGFT